MTEKLITGSCATAVAAPPSSVFDVLTDLDRLPSWNARMTRVVSKPSALTPGAEWVVEFHALGQTWHSRSVLDELDRDALRFAYRSGTDDGNPSRATWRWDVAADGDGSRVTVAWELRPVTFWRRLLLGRVRARQLARQEVPASLAALAAYVASTAAPHGTA